MFLIKKPVFPLSQFIKYFWIYEASPNLKSEIQTFIVQGCPIIIFHYKKPMVCKTGENDWAPHPRQCVIGQIKSFGEIAESGNEGMIAVVFYPDGLHPFIKAPIDVLTGLIIDLQDVMGKEIKDVQEKICECNNLDKRLH